VQPGVDLFGDGLTSIQVAGREAGVVAEGTAAGAEQAVAVGAGEARADRDLLDPAPVTGFHMLAPGVVAAFAEG
jgi:hypothetical protein